MLRKIGGGHHRNRAFTYCCSGHSTQPTFAAQQTELDDRPAHGSVRRRAGTTPDPEAVSLAPPGPQLRHLSRLCFAVHAGIISLPDPQWSAWLPAHLPESCSTATSEEFCIRTAESAGCMPVWLRRGKICGVVGLGVPSSHMLFAGRCAAAEVAFNGVQQAFKTDVLLLARPPDTTSGASWPRAGTRYFSFWCSRGGWQDL